MTRRGERGFTLIEVILGLTVMIIMVTAVSTLFVSDLTSVTLGKARAIALSLATEQMEYLRDLPYQSVATQNGAIYPPGSIPDSQVASRGGYTFTLKTEVGYVDDPADGNAANTIVGKSRDLNPSDYKKAQVSVYLKSSGKLVAQLTSDFAAKAAETASNTGVLSVLVKDANDNPITNASVTITNPSQSPAVNITATTDNLGYVTVPNLPPDSNNRYQVTASLSGYSTDQTIPEPSGAQTAVELNPDVLVQQVTTVVMRIDRISTLSLHVTDTSGNPLSNRAITTTGSKLIKQNADVHKYSQATTTDASGNITLNAMEWDSYSFTPPSGYYLVSVQPYAPVALNPNASLSVNLVLSTSSSFPRIASITPTGQQTGTAATAFKLTGTNLSGATVKLRQSGQPDITATSVTGSSTTLNGSFDLTGAATGSWDVVVTTGAGATTQTGGFSVTP